MSLDSTSRILILYSSVERVTLRRKKSPSGLRKSWSRVGRAKGKITRVTCGLRCGVCNVNLGRYDYYDEKTDNEYHQLFMFILVSCPLVLIATWAYLPDRRMRDWAIREAYLVIKEREAAGVEPLSKDLVDAEKILTHLPSDEELVKAGVVINI